jgi:hypothetical protein
MRFLYGDPDHLDALAHRLDQRAEQVVRLGDEMVHRAQCALWTSIAAEAYRGRMNGRRREFDHLAEDVRAAARQVRRHAQGVRDEMATLLAIEREVREFLRTVTNPPSWVPSQLPVVGDVAWRQLGRLVGRFAW